MATYAVIVGNIGTVYAGPLRAEAYRQFNRYKSAEGDYGRAAGEPVTLLKNGEPLKEHVPTKRLPAIKDVRALLIALKKDIGDDYRASDDSDDTTPGMCVTIGANDAGNWSWQTGDNSFTGGAYGYPDWAIVYLYRRSNCTELARDAVDQIAELRA